MMDDVTRALESAAFHAWVTFGDMLVTKAEVSKTEIKNAYDVLESALQAFKSAHGALYAAPTAAAEGTDPSSGPRPSEQG